MLDNGQRRLPSAAHCNNAGATVHDGQGHVIGRVSARAARHDCTGFRASGDDDGVSVAGGDSGGPIYDPRSDGRVGAGGISITSLLNRWNARIQT